MIPGCYNKQRPDGTCLAGTHLCLQADRRGWKRTEKNQLSTLRKVFCICCVLVRSENYTVPITVLRVQSIKQRRGKNGNYERMSAPSQKNKTKLHADWRPPHVEGAICKNYSPVKFILETHSGQQGHYLECVPACPHALCPLHLLHMTRVFHMAWQDELLKILTS